MQRRNSASTSDYDVAIIGAGNIGMSIARTLAPDLKVGLFDKGQAGKGAVWASGGMIRPITEASPDKDYLRLCLQSAALYPRFVEELEGETDMDLRYRAEGSILLAFTETEKAELEAKLRVARENGIPARMLTRAETKEREPSLPGEFLGALHMPSDVHLDNRRLAEALLKSCRKRGVDVHEDTPVISLEKEEPDIVIRSAGGHWIARVAVICAGAYSSSLSPTPEVRPVKGHMCRLDGKAAGLRHIISHHPLYLIPHEDGSVVVGSTEEDAGFDESLDQTAIQQLRKEAGALVPKLAGADILESWIGFRPLAEGGPFLGRVSDRMLAATGHYRNGILLTPITAKLMAKMVREALEEAHHEAHH